MPKYTKNIKLLQQSQNTQKSAAAHTPEAT